jgi:U3 small nucleolar RNA-associated protein 10
VRTKIRDDNSHVRSLGYLIALALIKKSSGNQQVDIAEQILSGLGVDEFAGVDDLSQEHLALEVVLNLALQVCFVDYSAEIR